jgi:hypothetical protein
MSLLRRSAAALATCAFAVAAAAPAALAAPSPSPSGQMPTALYGKGDPTYDGVWRQSHALLALSAAGVHPPGEAVTWLVGQQCPDGGFPSYRATGAPTGGQGSAAVKACDAKTEDTNATAAAVEALHALAGHQPQAERALAWLGKVRNKDGGWSYNPGGASDANSTAVVLDAYHALGRNPDEHALLAFQLTCHAPKDQRGAFAYQPNKRGDLYPNDSAGAAAARALLAHGLPVTKAVSHEAPAVACGKGRTFRPGAAAAAYLEHRLAAGGGHIDSPKKGAGPDYATTVDAALALAADGQDAQARTVTGWLEKHSAAWAKGQPAALADLILVCEATGTSPKDFGGTDLIHRLAALGPALPATSTADQHTANTAHKKDGGGHGLSVWFTVGIGLLVGVGAGFLLSMRKKRA